MEISCFIIFFFREKFSDKDYKCKNIFVIEYCNGRDIIEW